MKTGDYVKTGDLLAEMADLHKVRVRAFIDEPDLGGLEPDLPVRITWDALPNNLWQGKTEIIPKQVVARGSRSVGELLCSVDNDKLQLLPNTNVNVRINSKERTNVVTVPRGAVETENGKRYVFVVQNGVGNSTLEKREIQVGIADATSFEVVSGLQGNEVVALPGDVDLKDGMIVKVVNMDTSNIKGEKDAGYKTLFIALLCLFVWQGLSSAQDASLDAAKSAYEKGDYHKAIEILKSAAS